jgi:serine/threonine-protein kinase
LAAGARKTLLQNTAGARYLPTGHIVYAREGILFARRFDLARDDIAGEEVPVVEGVKRPMFLGGPSVNTPYFDVSNTGTLVYVPGPTTSSVLTDLALVDETSGTTLLKLPPRHYEFPRVSPDGKRVAVEVDDTNAANVWIYDLSGVTSIRQLTFGGKNRYPIWSADGRSVAFQSDREGDVAIYQQPADGGTAMRLTQAATNTLHIPDAWTADGRHLLFEEEKDGRYTLRSLSVADGTMSSVGDIQAPLYLNAALSPDGRWIAYRSSTGGASAVSVEPVPPTGAKYLIGNGVHPSWSRDGKTLFFRQLTTQELTATHVNAQSGFSFTNPEILPLTFLDRSSNATLRNHDVLPDGRFIGVVSASSQGGPDRINVVINWFEELKQKLPQ